MPKSKYEDVKRELEKNSKVENAIADLTGKRMQDNEVGRPSTETNKFSGWDNTAIQHFSDQNKMNQFMEERMTKAFEPEEH